MIYRSIFDRIFLLEISIAAGVFVIVAGLLVWSVVRRRAGSGREPSSKTSHPVLEATYAVVLAGVAAFLVVITSQANDRQQQAQAAPPATIIDVTAYQWCWEFRHTQAPVAVTDICRDPANWPTLVVPTGQPVQLRLTSRDVVHAMWIPALATKSDVYPDHTNTLTLTLDREGRWRGRCSEYCGQYHVMMDFYIQAVSPQEYQRYLASGGTATV